MNNIPLSPQVRLRLDLLFPADSRIQAEQLLVQRCGPHLPGGRKWTAFGVDRIRIAVMKLSDGTVAGLEKAIRLAEHDYRDLLMAAGFGSSLSAHLRWMPGEQSPDR